MLIQESDDILLAADTEKYVTFMLDDQLFALNVLLVEDIIKLPPTTPIPLAPEEIFGTLNLRGRIVTVIDLRRHLKTALSASDKNMTIIIDHKNNLYGCIVDAIGDIVNLQSSQVEKNFGTLDKSWKNICSGIYRMNEGLLLILDPAKLLQGIERVCGVPDDSDAFEA